jgi:hypothetical protein
MTVPERWRWPLVIIASTAIIDVLVFAGVDGPVRAIFAVWFVCVCPGMALARLLRLSDTWSEISLAIALSFSLALAVNMLLLYADWWSPELGLAILSVVSVAGAILQITLDPAPTNPLTFPLNGANQVLHVDTSGAERRPQRDSEQSRSRKSR